MKQFLATFMGSASAQAKRDWDSLDEKTRNTKVAQGMEAWGNWAKKNQAAIVNAGSPLGKTKKADAKGIADITNLLTAFTIVKAESHEEAAKMFLNHPHFMIFPGDSIEIMECLPMPQG